jgi:hypothetical protein
MLVIEHLLIASPFAAFLIGRFSAECAALLRQARLRIRGAR